MHCRIQPKKNCSRAQYKPKLTKCKTFLQAFTSAKV